MWPYRIFDNFLSQNIFRELSKIPYDHLKADDRVQGERNEYWSNGRTVCRSFSQELVQDIHAETHEPLMNVVRELAPNKVDRWWYTRMFMQQIGKDFSFNIHDERIEKILTAVVYLAPEVNRGTLVYTDRQGSDKKEIPWVPNRAFVYVPKKGVTWHSFEGDGISNRSTLIINFIRE